MHVPFMDLRLQHAPLKAEIMAAWAEILDTAGFVGGPHVAGFEAEFAAATGTSRCVALSTGTDALVLGLRALGVKPGDEVIVPANTFIATAEAVSLLGARPVFCDVLAGTWNIDPAAVRAAVTPRTVGVIGVHLYGQTFDVDAVEEVCAARGLFLIEDSAQGHLATYKGRPAGSLARLAAFSFYPGKNLGAPGEGGAVTTNDAALADRIARLREHGQSVKYHHEEVGYNARLPAILAAALRIKLKHLPGWTATRRARAARYLAGLEPLAAPSGPIELPVEAPFAASAYHLFVVHVAARDLVAKTLGAAGVGFGFHYPIPCHLQPCYADLGYQAGDFPNAEHNAAQCLSLPMSAELTQEQVDFVVVTLSGAVTRSA